MGETSLRVVERPHAFRTAKRGGRSPARGPGADCQGSGRRGGAARRRSRGHGPPGRRRRRRRLAIDRQTQGCVADKGNGNIVGAGVSADAGRVDPPARQQPIMTRALARAASVLLPIAPSGRLPSAIRHLLSAISGSLRARKNPFRVSRISFCVDPLPALRSILVVSLSALRLRRRSRPTGPRSSGQGAQDRGSGGWLGTRHSAGCRSRAHRPDQLGWRP